MAKGTPRHSDPAAAAVGANDFAALLQKEFRPTNVDRKKRIEAAVQGFADQALRDSTLVTDDVHQTIGAMLDALRAEQAQNPKKRPDLEEAINQLVDLQSYLEGREAAADLLGKVLKDPELLASLSSRSGFTQPSFEQPPQAWQNDPRFTPTPKDPLDDKPDSSSPSNVVERTERLASYAKEHGGDGLEEYARQLFPEWSVFQTAAPERHVALKELPASAPEKYQGLRGPETPPQFVQRVYGEWLGRGLTRAHIRALDPTLSQAIVNWSRKPENEWPPEVDLPTLKEQNDRLVSELAGGEPSLRTLKDARRLEGAITRRLRQQGE